jgi:uncharacterized OsmC-like protein
MQVTVDWRGAELVARRGSVNLKLPDSPTPEPDEPLCAGELLLAALGACAAETLRSHPTVAAMPIQSLRITVQADLLTHPSHYGNFRTTIQIEGDLTDHQCETVLRIARACRVSNTLQQASSVSVELADSRFTAASAGTPST